MKPEYAELTPLIEKVSILASCEESEDIYDWVQKAACTAKTPSMAQSVCSEVITMCHPKAWGDRNVTLFGSDNLAWVEYLGELSDIANKCGQQIFDNYGKNG